MKKVIFGLFSLLILVIIFFSGYLVYIGKVKNMLQYQEVDINTPYIQNIYHSVILENNLEFKIIHPIVFLLNIFKKVLNT